MTINNHGDLILLPVAKKTPPKTAKKSNVHVLQKSDTTGNRHEVAATKGFIFYWKNKEGQEFLHCENDYEIRHLGGDCEHGTQKVEKGTCKIEHEMEHDPWTNELKIVID